MNFTIYLLSILFCITFSGHTVNSSHNNAAGNGENLNVNEIDDDNSEIDHDESQKWMNMVLIAIGSILTIFTIVIACICYKQRGKRVENKRQINNAIMVTIEHEMEINNVDTTAKQTEIVLDTDQSEIIESTPNYECGIKNIIR